MGPSRVVRHFSIDAPLARDILAPTTATPLPTRAAALTRAAVLRAAALARVVAAATIALATATRA